MTNDGFVIPAERVEGNLPEAEVKAKDAGPTVRRDIEWRPPVDGDYDKLAIDGKKPGFEYFLANAPDMHRLKRWGAVEEKWAFDENGQPTNARPREWFGEGQPGETVRMLELTLLRLPIERARMRRDRDPARKAHNARIAAMLEPVEQGQGTFQAASVGIPGTLYPVAAG